MTLSINITKLILIRLAARKTLAFFSNGREERGDRGDLTMKYVGWWLVGYTASTVSKLGPSQRILLKT